MSLQWVCDPWSQGRSLSPQLQRLLPGAQSSPVSLRLPCRYGHARPREERPCVSVRGAREGGGDGHRGQTGLPNWISVCLIFCLCFLEPGFVIWSPAGHHGGRGHLAP